MDLKKVFDQTVRELKREVNKKVLKVPEIEVKVLEATSNEPWGPHGTIMADIAQATRNFNDYQLIMTNLYKRLSDTGRNWRHVYKSLTVLEYLVANGSERVIDELREHTYHIQTLVDFQYIEASGKDQGMNVRKKAQNLVSLINDKERIREVRQKANANREKYRGVSSTGMSFRPSTYSSTGGGYSDQDDDHYGGSYGGSRGGRDDYDSYGGARRDTDRYRDDDWSGREKDRHKDDGYGGDRDRNIEVYSKKGSFIDRYDSGASSDPDEDDFDPRGAFSAAASSASQPKDGFFGEAAPSVPSSAPPAVAKSTGGIEDLFGDIGFEVVPVPATSSNHTLQAPSEDLFGESAFQAAPSSAPDMFGAPAVQAAPPPSIPSLFPPPAFQQPTLPAKSVAAESLESFGSRGSNDNGGSMFPPPQASPAFDFAPNNGSGFSQGAMVLQVQSFGNQSIGSTEPSSNVQSYSNNEPSGNSLSTNTQQTQLESMQMQPSINCSMLQPQQQPKKTFAPLKSTLWADTLSTGLVDLNIAGPKVNPLADLGIQLTDASLRNELWGGSDNKKKDERKSIYGASSMGQAMGVGSGLGRAGASVLPSPPLPPPAALNGRMGMAPGVAPVTGMGPQMGLNPGMGMGVNLAMGMTPNMAPNMNMGMGQGVPNMWMGMGSYANQQYAGYR
ncbi:unnamed protein product [Sphagnum jensenii]|uniref:ENTH domain-containing protein n=1 Tax=Sphagnum jensenii TaxID=128206 RepID=A0ABP1AF09_9BRYO